MRVFFHRECKNTTGRIVPSWKTSEVHAKRINGDHRKWWMDWDQSILLDLHSIVPFLAYSTDMLYSFIVETIHLLQFLHVDSQLYFSVSGVVLTSHWQDKLNLPSKYTRTVTCCNNKVTWVRNLMNQKTYPDMHQLYAQTIRHYLAYWTMRQIKHFLVCLGNSVERKTTCTPKCIFLLRKVIMKFLDVFVFQCFC